MNQTCRYCHHLNYPEPSLGHTITLPRWKGEWAHALCEIDASEQVTKILVEMMMRLRRGVMARRAIRGN